MNGATLLDHETLVVRQKTKLFELRNQYELFDATGQPAGTVEQVNQSPLAVLTRIFSDLDVALPMELEVRDAGGVPALRLRKPWFRMTCDVTDGTGMALGSIRKKVRFGKARFSLLDPGGTAVGEVRAQNWRARDFSVVDATGLEVARVAKQWAGIARELFTDADHYVIHVSPSAQGPIRGLAVAAAWAIDVVMKQKDTGS